MAVEQRIVELVNMRLGTWLRQAEQALMAEKSRVLKPFGLTVSQYAGLHALSVAPLSGAQLARVCCVTPQSMASMLASLEARGLIERTQSEVHGMVLIASLTDAGRELFEPADAAALAVEARLSAAFTRGQDEQLREHLARAIAVLSAPGDGEATDETARTARPRRTAQPRS